MELKQTSQPLPPLLTVKEIGDRLALIFPEQFPDRGILVGKMAARVIFVFLYGGFIEGLDRYLRPSFIYFFTKQQSKKTSDHERNLWFSTAGKPGNRPPGDRWYADTSRESIRDDLMRNQLLRMGIMQKLPGYDPTASVPINYLSADFAYLFSPSLKGGALQSAIEGWSAGNLSPARLQRMKLKAEGIEARTGDLFVDLPDGTRIRISAGKSSLIAKDLIEQFATRHLGNPAVLWLSSSDKKSYPQFQSFSQSVGLEFDLNAELPDVILADLMREKFLFCEIVATDGPITDGRKQALLAIVRDSNIPENSIDFLTAYEDRGAAPFRKTFSQLAIGSMVWFRTEPDLLVVLTTANKEYLDLSGKK